MKIISFDEFSQELLEFEFTIDDIKRGIHLCCSTPDSSFSGFLECMSGEVLWKNDA